MIDFPMEGTKGPRFRDAIISDADGLTRLARSASLEALAHMFPPDQFPYPTVADRIAATDPDVRRRQRPTRSSH